ncbi:hypothetical protein [Chlamydia gallinacea]|uniref:hypothetical protein n=1 Tax=Chlamydia gallinacea TaxID=1457153 RepID=UPI0024E273BC|nr:hypothetical protein [Chlamydia gallinacea]
MTTPIQQPLTPITTVRCPSQPTQLQQRRLATVLCTISFISLVLFSACVATAITSGCLLLWTLPVTVALVFVLSVLALRRLCPKSIPATQEPKPSEPSESPAIIKS